METTEISDWEKHDEKLLKLITPFTNSTLCLERQAVTFLIGGKNIFLCTNSVVQYHPENCSTVVFFLLSCHRFSTCFSILKLLCQGPNFAACHISVFQRQQKIKGEPPPFSPIQHPIRADEFESNKKIFMSAGPYLCEEGQ